MFGPSVRAGWNDNYNTFAAWVDQTTLNDVIEVGESGGAVTFTLDLSNSAGTDVPYTDTFNMDNGIITSNIYSQN